MNFNKLRKILEDPFYSFNKNFIFEVFIIMLRTKDSQNTRDQYKKLDIGMFLVI